MFLYQNMTYAFLYAVFFENNIKKFNPLWSLSVQRIPNYGLVRISKRKKNLFTLFLFRKNHLFEFIFFVIIYHFKLQTRYETNFYLKVYCLKNTTLTMFV